jgi:hypothetical protein
MTSYYDIDSILAEEELIPCTSLFEFNYLAELDPDGTHHDQRRKTSDDDTTTGNTLINTNYLPENSRIKIPLWVVKGWAMQGFVRLQLPRHYSRKARERYDADPGDADLRYVLHQHTGRPKRCDLYILRFVKLICHFLSHTHVLIVVL